LEHWSAVPPFLSHLDRHQNRKICLQRKAGSVERGAGSVAFFSSLIPPGKISTATSFRSSKKKIPKKKFLRTAE
jgi:hypothetical protein